MSNNVSIVLDKKKYYQAMSLCILGNFLWGFSYMLTRTAQQYAVPAVQLSCRFMVTFVVMSIMMIWIGWSSPAGVLLFWGASSLLAIAQQQISMRIIEKKDAETEAPAYELPSEVNVTRKVKKPRPTKKH